MVAWRLAFRLLEISSNCLRRRSLSSAANLAVVRLLECVCPEGSVGLARVPGQQNYCTDGIVARRAIRQDCGSGTTVAYQISLKMMKRFADALWWHMRQLTTGNPTLVMRPQPDGGFHLTTAPASGNVLQARFNGFTVAVTMEWRGTERLLNVSYDIEREHVVAYLLSDINQEPMSSREFAEVLLARFLARCDPAPDS